MEPYIPKYTVNLPPGYTSPRLLLFPHEQAPITRSSPPPEESSFTVAPGIKVETTKLLGKTHQSAVWKVLDKTNKKVYAMKILLVPPTDDDAKELARTEVEHTIGMDSDLPRYEHIVHAFWPSYGPQFGFFMDVVADCDLGQYLDECMSFPLPADRNVLTNWFGCLASALHFVHSNRTAHGNIKPSNILIDGVRVLLSDIGGSCSLELSGSEHALYKGSAAYWPPEYHTVRNPRAPDFQTADIRAADVFALGCVFAEMLVVRQGFSVGSFEAMRVTKEHDSTNYACPIRDNVEGVKWILDSLPLLKGEGPWVKECVRKTTCGMIEFDWKERKNMEWVKEELFNGASIFFCEVCEPS